MIVRTCIALWDYHPVTATSISIVEGEQLVVLNDDDAHWIKVRRMDGIEGYVPRNYTQLQTAAARGNDRHILPASPRSPSPTLLSPKIPGYDQKSNSGDELSDDYDKRRKKKEKKRDNKGTVKRPVKWTRQNSEQSLHIIEAIANAAAESAEPEMMNLEGELNGGNPEISNPVLVNKTKDPRVLVADAKSGKAEKEKRGILGSKTDREKSKEKEREKEKEKEKDREDRETASKKLKRHTVKIPTMVRGSMKDKDRDVEISMPQFKEERKGPQLPKLPVNENGVIEPNLAVRALVSPTARRPSRDGEQKQMVRTKSGELHTSVRKGGEEPKLPPPTRNPAPPPPRPLQRDLSAGLSLSGLSPRDLPPSVGSPRRRARRARRSDREAQWCQSRRPPGLSGHARR